MAVSAIAEHVDHHGLVEQLPELGGDLSDMNDRFRIVAVHVEDRRLDHPRHVGGIGRGAREAGCGGEADLIVDDEVERAAGAVAGETRQAEALGDHALAGKRRIAMQQACGMTCGPRSMSLNWSCLARTLPSTTGSTISKCDGFAVSERCTLLPSNERSDEAPR